MLAAYLTWHLRQAWALLAYTDEEPPAPASPIAPAARSASTEAKASRQHDEHGRPYCSFQGLLAHLKDDRLLPACRGRSKPDIAYCRAAA
jgi:hypothetical protein